MSSSYQNEIPKARINLKLSLHAGVAQKETEFPLKLVALGELSHGQMQCHLSKREKQNVTKNNFDVVLAEYSPTLKLSVKNATTGDVSDIPVSLSFNKMKDFGPEQVAAQIPQLKAMMATRNLLCDLRPKLLDNARSSPTRRCLSYFAMN